jgi:hypothetical protein
MKYMLLMSGKKADFEWYFHWTKEQIQAHTAFMHAFNKELKDAGKLVAAEGLGFPQEARRVRAGQDGEPITDGIFPETKEFLAGYWIVDVDNAEEAYRLAARACTAPHPPLGQHGPTEPQTIEVRQVMSGPPEEPLR